MEQKIINRAELTQRLFDKLRQYILTEFGTTLAPIHQDLLRNINVEAAIDEIRTRVDKKADVGKQVTGFYCQLVQRLETLGIRPQISQEQEQKLKAFAKSIIMYCV